MDPLTASGWMSGARCGAYPCNVWHGHVWLIFLQVEGRAARSHFGIPRVVSDAPSSDSVEVTFTPTGALIDGSAGQTIVRTDVAGGWR
jgi:hypothetical protein